MIRSSSSCGYRIRYSASGQAFTVGVAHPLVRLDAQAHHLVVTSIGPNGLRVLLHKMLLPPGTPETT